ncbi:MAG TPA: hypothetical protein VM578_08290 [Candidatus Saccharimonadales bacterium]|nr:hypothetical protein [Candidatus Saccharimonadales bacterium]
MYSARHTFGTYVYKKTKNLALVMKSTGHTETRTAMRKKRKWCSEFAYVTN